MFFSGCTRTGFSNPEISENTFYLLVVVPSLQPPKENIHEEEPCMCASGTVKTKDFARDFECGERGEGGERATVLSESCLPKGDGREKKLKLMARAGVAGLGEENMQLFSVMLCHPECFLPSERLTAGVLLLL